MFRMQSVGLALFVTSWPALAHAATVSFTFTAVVTQVDGVDLMCSHTEPGDVITATVSYDLASPPFDAGGDGTGYHVQSLFTIDGEDVPYDDDLVWIRNNDGGFGDIFAALLWRGEDSLDRATLQMFDQRVDGFTGETGLVFDDESLPSTLDRADFGYSTIVFQDFGGDCAIDSDITTVTGGLVDGDGDGISDDDDNCPTVANADQADSDIDGIGDACEADSDADGVVDDLDNCPADANPDQADNESDGIGDACDADDDNDDVPDATDVCATTYDPAQTDTDGDGQGDACDGDDDGDGIDDGDDVCPGTSQGTAVGADGCSGVQYVESHCPQAGPWPNLGDYVSCVAGASQEAQGAGLLTNSQRAAIVRAAARGR